MDTQIRIAGRMVGSVTDGPGYNYVIFLQGCNHGCEGCHNPETHDFKGGYLINMEELTKDISSSICTGITLSGGDPMQAIMRMEPYEYSRFIAMIEHFKGREFLITCYTGYRYSQINGTPNSRIRKLLSLADILIDGRFEIGQKKELPFRGSENQTIIALSDKGNKALKDCLGELWGI